MHVHSNFILAKKCEEPKCLSTGKRINNLLYRYNGISLNSKKKQIIDTSKNMN